MARSVMFLPKLRARAWVTLNQTTLEPFLLLFGEILPPVNPCFVVVMTGLRKGAMRSLLHHFVLPPAGGKNRILPKRETLAETERLANMGNKLQTDC
jgi:hypothetical protein